MFLPCNIYDVRFDEGVNSLPRGMFFFLYVRETTWTVILHGYMSLDYELFQIHGTE